MRDIIRGALIASAIAGACLPAAAIAGDETRARAATEVARGKIEANDKADLSGGPAADAQARAKQALAMADSKVRDDNEDRAVHAARKAEALADLAQARSELDKLKQERAALAQR